MPAVIIRNRPASSKFQIPPAKTKYLRFGPILVQNPILHKACNAELTGESVRCPGEATSEMNNARHIGYGMGYHRPDHHPSGGHQHGGHRQHLQSNPWAGAADRVRSRTRSGEGPLPSSLPGIPFQSRWMWAFCRLASRRPPSEAVTCPSENSPSRCVAKTLSPGRIARNPPPIADSTVSATALSNRCRSRLTVFESLLTVL